MQHEDETTIAAPERPMRISQRIYCGFLLVALGTTRFQQCAGLAPFAGNTARASAARPVALYYRPPGGASNRRGSYARDCPASLFREYNEAAPGAKPAGISGGR